MQTHQKSVLAIGLASMLALAACGKTVPPGQVSDAKAAEAPKESASLGAALDDTGITAKIKGRLGSDGRTQNADIHVETNNGIVTLGGSVASAEVKDAAEELVRNVPDVKGVDNQIVSPSAVDSLANKAEKVADSAETAVSDTVVTTRLKAALIADERTKGTEIKVTTESGRVTLAGTVGSTAERERAIEIAKATEGVKKVESTSLKVASK